MKTAPPSILAIAIAFAGPLVTLLLSSCTSPRVGAAAPRVYWVGTPEYRTQVARLKLSRSEAESWLRQFYGNKPRSHTKADEAAVVDDWYRFSGPFAADICLGGMYVHGMTGVIQSRGATHETLKYRGQPGNFQWVYVDTLQGPIDRGKLGQLPYALRRTAERSFPIGFFMPPRPRVESKLPPDKVGELHEPSKVYR